MKYLSVPLFCLLFVGIYAINHTKHPIIISQEDHLSNCVDSNGSDRGCDSCFYAVYGHYNPDTTQYSYGHYSE